MANGNGHPRILAFIGGTLESVTEIHRLDLPLPWELGQVNAYLVPGAAGWTLVDCGMTTPECFAALDMQLQQAGVAWRDIKTLLLTHMHPDHMGLAPKVLELSGAQLAMHRREFALLEETVEATEQRREPDEALTLAHTPLELQTKVIAAFTDVRRSFVRLTPDVLLEGGERWGDAEVVWTPGHSPGHVCLHFDDGALLTGDHLLENITPNISWVPGEDALGDFIESLKRVAELDCDTLYPSHGLPFTGHREWATQTIAHHHERCDEIVTALRLHPRTAHELVSILWPRRLSAFHYRFAVYEVLAHLECLRNLSQVVLEPDRTWTSTID